MEEYYDIVIFGGGTVGIATLLTAVSGGLKAILIEKGQVGTQTNNNSLGLIQRDPKYLHTDVDLVRINALDCGLIKTIAGDFMRKQKIIIPVFSNSKYPLCFWDGYIEALDKFTELSRTERHKLFSKGDLLLEEPFLRKDLNGGVAYEEWITNPLELTSAMAKGAVALGAEILEQSEIRGCQKHAVSGKKTIEAVCVENKADGRSRWIFGSYFINATGPWAPNFPLLLGIPGFEARLTRGTSVIINERLSRNAVIVFNNNGKYITILPFGENYTLIGPTNYDVSREVFENPNLLKSEEFEKDELIETASKFFEKKISKTNIVEVKCGLRPQLNHRKVKPDNITHEFIILDHDERDGVGNFCSVFGGKLSNQLRMAKEAVDFAYQKIQKIEKDGRIYQWKIPQTKITKDSIRVYQDCGQDCSLSSYHLEKYALSFKDKVGRTAMAKRVKSLIFIAPFILRSFLREGISAVFKEVKGG